MGGRGEREQDQAGYSVEKGLILFSVICGATHCKRVNKKWGDYSVMYCRRDGVGVSNRQEAVGLANGMRQITEGA